MTKRLPLLFSFRQPVFGEGFLAGIKMDGRALMDEGDETWLTGVAPVGFAANGADRGAAFLAFRNAWVAILFDIASESRSFGEFKKSCEGFLSAASHNLTADWEAALADVRRTSYVDPNLKREPSADQKKVRFEIVDLTQFQHTPEENILEAGLQAAA